MQPLNWTNPEAAGLLTRFLSKEDPRSAVAQLDHHYQHGGGWCEFKGFTLKKGADDDQYYIFYPGDPPYLEVSRTQLREETVVLFQSAWVAVIQSDGNFKVARMD